MFQTKNTQRLELVLKVLFPETLIKLYMDICDMNYEQAEEELFKENVSYYIVVKNLSYFYA